MKTTTAIGPLVFGSQGQVASALRKCLPSNTRFLSQLEAPLENLAQLRELVQNLPATSMICPAAYTQVDKAESEPELCHKLNAEAPELLAQICRERDLPFVWYSTDYVFDGSGESPKKETDPTGPLNVYGKSKLEGERRIIAVGGRFLIFRTSWVISPYGTNFVKTMLRLGAERSELKIVADQWGAPTSAHDLALASVSALDKALEIEAAGQPFPSGVYHLTNSGETSWFGLAQRIFSLAQSQGLKLAIQDLAPISSADFPTPAQRPKNSRLLCDKFTQTFGLKIPSWEEGLGPIVEAIIKT